jgi:hypothetical protein
MKIRKHRWDLLVHAGCAHRILVTVHSSRSAMRRALTLVGHKSDNTEAACWQSNNPGRDYIVAEMHFGADALTLDSITHESVHAAMQRARLLGYPTDSDGFEECVATDAGRLAEACVVRFRRAGLKLRAKC